MGRRGVRERMGVREWGEGGGGESGEKGGKNGENGGSRESGI